MSQTMTQKCKKCKTKIKLEYVDIDMAYSPTPPKLGVSQAKNIDALGFMLQQENWRRENESKEKLAELEFSLSDYAKVRGYTDEQIARGGEFYSELKRDLFTGAYTTYRLDKVIIDGKEYTAHGLPNIYILLEPKNPKDKWKIKYNEPYKDYYWWENVKNADGKQSKISLRKDENGVKKWIKN